ncbi:MAG: L-2-hydroxyglutarate oxidase LhgO [Gammaproteobacteria bacterium]|jgi:L-2-hydroxyglutarate oxidase LhgO
MTVTAGAERATFYAYPARICSRIQIWLIASGYNRPIVRRCSTDGLVLEHVQCIVAGAGVVGLAIARELAMAGREVLILEAENAIGTGVSSRNSCVIHAGIYYPANSVRANVCVPGKHALYEFCESHGVSHQRIGKIIVATEESQIPALHAIAGKAAANGVHDLVPLDQSQARELEPNVDCVAAMLSPSTGIVDVHEYMLALLGDAESHGAMLALATPVTGGDVRQGRITITAGEDADFEVSCDTFVNCAALGAQALARGLAGLDADTIPTLHYAKGNYYSLMGRTPFSRLIYPMPQGAWLGVHATLDLAGRCRFGPDLHWVDDLNYDVDAHAMDDFYASIRRWWPDLADGQLQPDYSGIRPKIYGPGEEAADFLLQGPATHGIAGLVNLYGIESPGITSSLAIAEQVRALLDAGAPAMRAHQ